VWNALEAALAAASSAAFRIIHYSVQTNHLHLILEATDRAALLSGLRGLAIRTARAVNRAAGGRHGRVWAERCHVHELRSPREVRNALVYVLHNLKKTVRGVESLDGCATGYWFDGWRGPRPAWARPPAGVTPPVRAARTWLLTTGWRQLGLIGFDEQPRPEAKKRRRRGGDAAAGAVRRGRGGGRGAAGARCRGATGGGATGARARRRR
jgi:REP element-mobilizing transposase RayT